jgi:hypothetical protein
MRFHSRKEKFDTNLNKVILFFTFAKLPEMNLSKYKFRNSELFL